MHLLNKSVHFLLNLIIQKKFLLKLKKYKFLLKIKLKDQQLFSHNNSNNRQLQNNLKNLQIQIC